MRNVQGLNIEIRPLGYQEQRLMKASIVNGDQSVSITYPREKTALMAGMLMVLGKAIKAEYALNVAVEEVTTTEFVPVDGGE